MHPLARARFDLTIRKLLLSCAAFAFAIALISAAEQIPLEQELTARLRTLGVRVFPHPRTGRVIEVNANQNAEFGNDQLRWLASFSELTDLSLESTPVDDEGISRLTGLKKLEWLNLYRTKVGDDALRALSEIKSLRHLPIGETRVTDRGLVHLKSMDQLVYLGLRGNKITDDGLRPLTSLTNLTGLHLGETAISDAGLERLRKLTSLKELWLQSAAVTDASVPILLERADLEKLDLTKTKVTPEGLKRLRTGLPHCEILSSEKRTGL